MQRDGGERDLSSTAGLVGTEGMLDGRRGSFSSKRFGLGHALQQNSSQTHTRDAWAKTRHNGR